MKLVYDVKDRPKFKANLVFALQQLLAIIAATLLVPTLVNLSYGKEVLNQAAALLGAGVGTLTYILCESINLDTRVLFEKFFCIILVTVNL